MNNSSIIDNYFPALSPIQQKQMGQLGALYADWNSKINVISRKDIDNFYQRHVLHSLSIAKIISFKPATRILDVGTGGGFPGIPLAILFPHCEFHLADSIGKKIKVVNAIAEALALKNVKGIWARAEEVKEKYHFVVSRAVTEMPEFIKWVNHKFLPENFNSLPNGILYLRGDNTENYPSHDLKDFFGEDFFETKKLIYVQGESLRSSRQ
jgi:16S rRNA (guanine527-N7)-methyltransferase